MEGKKGGKERKRGGDVREWEGNTRHTNHSLLLPAPLSLGLTDVMHSYTIICISYVLYNFNF